MRLRGSYKATKFEGERSHCPSSIVSCPLLGLESGNGA
jgi:hypothetical protein